MHRWMMILALAAPAAAQTLAPEVKAFVKYDDATIVLKHVRVIDGSGAPARDDQTVVISGGKIESVGASVAREGAKVLDLAGYTVIPGLVGMHNHLYYTASLNLDETGALHPPGFFLNELPFTAPRLYLACGVTSMRTTGCVDPFTDMNLKQAIDSGRMPGPKLHLTAPYLEGAPGGSMFPQMHELTGPDDARRMVEFWSDLGFTSFKAYMHVTHAELQAAVDAAHKRGLKLTAHLCSIGYREAAEIGVDDLEHGFVVDTEFAKTKKPDECPSQLDAIDALVALDPKGEEAQKTFRALIDHHVAVTSTLPVFEASVGTRPDPSQRVLDALASASRESLLAARARAKAAPSATRSEALLRQAMVLERAFAAAGGTLLAGPDPTGNGGVLPGFGDQREVELLVEAGFSFVEAIHIATANGAEFLGESARVGTIAPGKQADLVLIHGDPSKNVADLEKVELVFKDGVAYDSAKLIESVRGMVGLR